MSRAVAILPARWGSTRLPGKPLIDIHGKPLIRHVWERVSQARALAAVIVATDDARIADAVAAFGGRAVMTRGDHVSGTDRLVEAMADVPADIYLNVQGDEPLVDPDALDALVAALEDDGAIQVATLAHPIDAAEAAEPNRVKVVTDAVGDALYFSRAPIPFARDPAAARYHQHVGVYAFAQDVLARWPSLPPSPLEQAESLEQLRLLSAGIAIRVLPCRATGPGVDTPESLETVRAIMAERG